MDRTQTIAALAIALSVSACGGKGSSTSPSASVQAITVTSSSDTIFVGASEPFTATASLSGGGTQPVTSGTWGSDTPSVAMVDGSGRVTGVGSGVATIFVDYQGRRGTKLIRGLPNFQGAWSGSYVVTSCSDTGDFARSDFCDIFPRNHVFPTNMNLTQDGDRVEGRFFLGTLGADGSGPVQTNGQLLLSGAIKDDPATVETSWTLASSMPGRITGRFSMLWRASRFSGDMRVKAEIRDLNRTSSLTAPLPIVPASGGSLEAMLRAIRGR